MLILYRVPQEIQVFLDQVGHQGHLDHLGPLDQMAQQVPKEIQAPLALLEGKEILDLRVPMDQLDQLVVMENLVVMVGMGTEENKDQSVHKDQE